MALTTDVLAFWRDMLANRILLASILGWTLAQVSKWIIHLILYRSFSRDRLWGSGGMPSSHSALTTALAVAVARFDGIASPAFAIAVIFAFVTMYDAMGVRREVGRHAELLNKYLNELEQKKADTDGDGKPDETPEEIELKELIGHEPLQVIVGVLIGILAAILIPV